MYVVFFHVIMAEQPWPFRVIQLLMPMHLQFPAAKSSGEVCTCQDDKSNEKLQCPFKSGNKSAVETGYIIFSTKFVTTDNVIITDSVISTCHRFLLMLKWGLL